MTEYNFQEWLNTSISDDPEVVLAGKLEYLRLYLTDAMRDLREKAGLTQAEFAQKLGVQQAAISKLESAAKDHKLESVLQYLHALNADLLIAVKQGNNLYQVSENNGNILIDLPESIQEAATAQEMTIRDYVMSQLQPPTQSPKSIIQTFLESNDEVAVKVRARINNQSLSEIANKLEKSLRQDTPEDEDKDELIKEILEDYEASAGVSRDVTGYDSNAMELLYLAQDLHQKLIKIISQENLYADFSEMAADTEYQQEALTISQEFAQSDWEALQLGESEYETR